MRNIVSGSGSSPEHSSELSSCGAIPDLQHSFWQVGREPVSEQAVSTSIDVTLFGAPGCHLCDEARGVVRVFEREHLLRVTSVNAHDSFELIQSYGLRIPVLRFPDGQEMNWPFSPEDVRRAIQAHTS
jgi:hypothetical protein